MNKKIFAGLAAASLAAMPLFSSNAALERTDHLNVTVEKGCSFSVAATDGQNNSVSLANKTHVEDIEGVKFDVSCPGDNDKGWQITAMSEDGSGKLTDGQGNSIATGKTLDGSASNWAFKVVGTGSAKIEGTYNEYSAVPTGEAEKIAGGVEEQAKENATVQAFYAVSIGEEQQPGTYTGGVTYTLTNTGE